MGHTLFSMLGLFLLNTLLYCGPVEDKARPDLTVCPSWLSPGASVTLNCTVTNQSAGWSFFWYQIVSVQPNNSYIYELLPGRIDGTEQTSSIVHGQKNTAGYACRAGRGDPVFSTKYSQPKFVWSGDCHAASASVRVSPDRVQHFSEESVSLHCEGKSSEWRVMRLSELDHLSNCSVWGTMTRSTCTIDKFGTEQDIIVLSPVTEGEAVTKQERKYHFVSGRTNSGFAVGTKWTYLTDRASVKASELDLKMGHTLLSVLLLHLLNTLLYYGHAQVLDAVLMTDPNWSTFFTGESVTFICDMNEGDDADWEYKINKDGRDYVPYNTHQRYTSEPLSTGDSGDYQCVGRRRSSYSTKSSNTVSLTVSAKPKATLTADTTTISVGGSVTLTCSVQNSVGWKYEWFRRTQRTSEVLVDPVRTNDELNTVISVSQGGIYQCRGTRGKPVYYTDISDEVTIEKTLSNEAVLRRQPDWTQMFSGERINLTCEIHGGETTLWMYDWRGPQYYVPWTDDNYQTFRVSESNSGDYMCRSRPRDDSYSSTEWSKSITLSVSDKPKAVLSVSPSWLSPGTSVTLSCEVEHPSAGWRFYLYKTVPDLSGTSYSYEVPDLSGTSYSYEVPDLSGTSYSYELLPGSINGTEQDSYILHGQTQTAGFTCRAGRGDPEYYSDYSDPTFVWSEDLHSAASLTVNPDTVQHFGSKSVSLRCDGNSTKWRVSRFTDDGFQRQCFFWGTMNGSTCNLNWMWYGNAVYWCESGSAFSNAVNITGEYNDGIILVSPVHPVTEGDSVTLGCKLRTQNVLSNVFFYKDNKLIQNDSRGEMSISAVSESDEGFYKCQYSGKESPQSWMAVKKSSSEKSSFPVLLITGLVCGVLLILILLFLLVCCCRKIKDPHCDRLSQSLYINQGSAVHQPESQNETQVYSSLLYGDASVYESIRGSGNTDSGGAASDYINVTSSHQPQGCEDP
ncbi:uncharacterized protein LOC129348180 [Amphiprion ocellaris]|uniref:uncharacterized protein LOC129348180 n=1 Tax=Amphiprion ocellaris TaxID=80972 RepID=UPI0024118BE3|nr:uncharacterized protein LOC129348180 [Amphiprion ocellaris]